MCCRDREESQVRLLATDMVEIKHSNLPRRRVRPPSRCESPEYTGVYSNGIHPIMTTQMGSTDPVFRTGFRLHRGQAGFDRPVCERCVGRGASITVLPPNDTPGMGGAGAVLMIMDRCIHQRRLPGVKRSDGPSSATMASKLMLSCLPKAGPRRNVSRCQRRKAANTSLVLLIRGGSTGSGGGGCNWKAADAGSLHLLRAGYQPTRR